MRSGARGAGLPAWRGASGWSIVGWHPGGHDTGHAEVLKRDLRIPPTSQVGAERGPRRRVAHGSVARGEIYDERAGWTQV
jgi:hypothetical protein